MVQSVVCRLALASVLIGLVGFAPASIQAQEVGGPSPVEIVPNVPHSPVSLALSPDRRMLLSGGYDGSVKLWDFATGRLLRTFLGHSQKVRSVRFVSNGAQVLSASEDMTIKLWDAATGRLLRTTQLQSPAKYFHDIQLSPDGTHALSGQTVNGTDPAGVMKLWDVATGRVLRSFRADPKAVAFSPDGTRVISGGAGIDHTCGGQIKLWDATTGQLLRTLEGHKGCTTVERIIFSPDGNQLLSYATDNTAKLWDAASGRVLKTFDQPHFVRALAFSPDGSRVVLGDDTGTVMLWDVATARLVRTFQAKAETTVVYSVEYLSFTPDGTDILSAGYGIALWDVVGGERPVRIFGGYVGSLWGTAFSHDAARLLVGNTDKTAKMWDATTGQLVRTFVGHSGPVQRLVVSSDNTRVVTAGGYKDNTVKLWDATTGQLLRTFVGHSRSVEAVAVSPDGTRIVSGGDTSVRLWDVATGQLLRNFVGQSSDGIEAVAFSPSGALVLSGGYDGAAKLWDVSSGRLIRSFKHSDGIVFAVAFSPDGSKVLSGSGDDTAKLWDAATGKLIRTFSGRSGVINSVAFSSDGSRVLIDGNDNTARLWDAASGRLLRSFDGAFSAEFWPGRDRLLLRDGYTLKSVDAGTGDLLATFVVAESGEWLTITSEGFFVASENGGGLLSVVRGFDLWSIDQFYQSLYRPDLVREKLAGDPRGLVRIAAANLDLNKAIASGSAPDVRLTLPGRALGTGAVDNNQVSAEAEITDRGGGIGRVEWRVNGVTAGVDTPAPGTTGQPTRLMRSLVLDPGDNKIEVVAYNGANLIASRPARVSAAAQIASPSIVPSQPAAPPAAPAPAPVAAAKPRLFVLVAGVNEYADKRFKLSYAISDAREVARGFQVASGSLYQSVEVRLMTDAEVTRVRLDAAFAEMAGKTSASDVFVLYLAGHGKTVDGRYYFAPQDFAVEGELTDKAINAAVKAKAIAQEQWQRWFATIPARKSVILFDTCDSGTLAGDETQQLEKGAANSRLSQATGRSILTASGGSQEALEGYHGHGLFTYEILDAINQADGDRNGTIELNELAAYVYAQVSELSEKVFKQRQVPEMKITANFPLAKQTLILQDETIPIAEAKPTYQVAQTAQLQVQPNSGATVVRSLSAKTPVTVLESKDGWSLIASEGKPLGYVATRDLAPVQ